MQPNNTTSAINTGAIHINYADTGFFSDIVADYLRNDTKLSPFFKYTPDINGIKKAIAKRNDYRYDRETLVNVLHDQYKDIHATDAVTSNIKLILNQNTFTITTAHQPNIFTGPLYFIYKILHVIKIAETLKKDIPGYSFVPVFYMGSEDADLDELGNFTVDGKKYEWKTKQTGAVGRMKVDKNFLGLIDELNGQLSVLPFGKDVIALFREAYKLDDTLQHCTLKVVNELFGRYGLIVLIPDEVRLKKLFIPVIEKELNEQFSHKAVEKTMNTLGEYYKVQTGGRELNLFYLVDDKRERIELADDGYKVNDLSLSFSKQEMRRELNEHAERFSPNVILRGVFQEMILPDIAFVGGGAEIAYWLELKNVFEEINVPYPVLLLRNSFLLMPNADAEQLAELGFDLPDIFKGTDVLLKELTIKESGNKLSLSEEKGALNSFYQELHESVKEIDLTLAEHVNALQVKALKRIEELEKKMLRAEKRKYDAEKRRIQKLRSGLFPNDSLQERVENISGFYAREGDKLIDILYSHSLTVEQKFTIVQL